MRVRQAVNWQERKQMPRRTSCINCGGAAELLCDFKLGGVHGGIEKIEVPKPMEWEVIDATKMPYRCDVPICHSCATYKGNIFMSHYGSDSIDYCPMHAHMDESHPYEPITEPELFSMRRDIAAYYRRKKMHLASNQQEESKKNAATNGTDSLSLA
jgi:hypothetical protein